MRLIFNRGTILAGITVALLAGAMPILAQYPPPPPPGDADRMVQRIALYPDPLLAQVLTASTFWDQIPDAAGWANEHSYLHGPDLAAAIQADRLPWDPSVLALLPFPSVLDMMARDPGWTQALGNAVLADRAAVMDAVQRDREAAMNYGYLQSNGYVRVVHEGGYIEILPVNAGVVYVPAYDPYVVFARPRPGFVVGGAIHFGPGITIGAAFAPFGWRSPYLGWHEHTIVIDGHPWARTFTNREHYVHPYAEPWHRPEGRREEHHEHHDHDRHDH